MSYRIAKAAAVLRDEIDGRWPGREKQSDGWVADDKHTSSSDHSPNNPKHKGVVTAIDVTDWQGIARQIAEHLRATKDPRVKYVIDEGEMFSSYSTSSRRAWEWGPYSGSNAHRGHCHISLVDDRAGYDDESPWGLEGTWMHTIKAVLFYANTIDKQFADAGSEAAHGEGLFLTSDLEAARSAVAGGVKVYAVGGPACEALPEAIPLKGQHRAGTNLKVATQAANGF